MARRALLAGMLVGLVAPVSGCLDEGVSLTGGDVFAAIDAPQWKAGYTWSYLVNGNVHVEMRSHVDAALAGGEDQEEEVVVDEPLVDQGYFIEVLTTTIPNGEVPMYLAALADDIAGRALADAEVGPDVLSAAEAAEHILPLGFRQRDLRGSAANITAGACDEGDPESCGPPGVVYEPDDPSFTFLDFPLEKGKTWGGETASRATGTSIGDGAIGMRYSATAGGMRALDLPVGRVEALPVDFDFTPLGIDAYVESEREKAAADGGDLRMTLEVEVDEVAYYAPAYQAVVRTEVDVRVLMDVVVLDDEGHAVRVHMLVRVDVVEELSGARLVERPERPLSSALAVFTGAERLGSPNGTSLARSGYQIDLVADATTVNAADGGAVSFTVNAIGTELPAGHTLTHRIAGPDGALVAQGEGASFGHSFDTPGVYLVEALAVDEDGKGAAYDGLTLVANYAAEVPVGCPIVGLFGITGTCDDVDVPVTAGVRTLTVTAIADPAPLADTGTLILSDGAGMQWSAGGSGSTYELVLDDFEGATFDGAPWTLSLDPGLAVLPGATYLISLDYGGARADETEEGGSWAFVARVPAASRAIDRAMDGAMPGNEAAALVAELLATLP